METLEVQLDAGSVMGAAYRAGNYFLPELQELTLHLSAKPFASCIGRFVYDRDLSLISGLLNSSLPALKTLCIYTENNLDFTPSVLSEIFRFLWAGQPLEKLEVCISHSTSHLNVHPGVLPFAENQVRQVQFLSLNSGISTGTWANFLLSQNTLKRLEVTGSTNQYVNPDLIIFVLGNNAETVEEVQLEIKDIFRPQGVQVQTLDFEILGKCCKLQKLVWYDLGPRLVVNLAGVSCQVKELILTGFQVSAEDLAIFSALEHMTMSTMHLEMQARVWPGTLTRLLQWPYLKRLYVRWEDENEDGDENAKELAKWNPHLLQVSVSTYKINDSTRFGNNNIRALDDFRDLFEGGKKK